MVEADMALAGGGVSSAIDKGWNGDDFSVFSNVGRSDGLGTMGAGAGAMDAADGRRTTVSGEGGTAACQAGGDGQSSST